MADYIKDNEKKDILSDVDNVDSAVSDAMQRKNERMQRRIESEWMRKKAIVSVCIILLVLIVVISVAVFIKNTVKNDSAEEDKNTVLTIDGENISRDEFIFFCGMILQSDIFSEISAENSDIAFLTEYVKSAATENIEEFLCKVHDASERGITLTEQEISDISSEIDAAAQGYASRDEYCYKYYGMDYEEYFNLSKQMSLVSKSVQSLSEEADLSRENQKKLYSENTESFTVADVKMIYMDIRGLDADSLADKKSNAETFLDYIKEGLDIGTLSKEHSDKNALFDIDEYGGNTTVRFSSDVDEEFSKLTSAVLKMQRGDVKIIETDKEICVVECVSKGDFEDSFNSDGLISYIKYLHASEYFNSLLASGKYSAKINQEIYNETDISGYVEAAIGVYSQGK